MDNSIFEKSLSIVGLDGPGCSPSEVLDKISKKYEEYQRNVQDTVNSLSAKSFGAFLATVTALMGQITAGAGLSILNGIVVNGVFGNIIGSVAMLMGLVLASVTGIYMMLKYLAVKALKKNLENRIKLGLFLDSEISQMIAFFQALARTIERGKQLNIDEIIRALRHVKTASIRVATETRKSSTSVGSISAGNIDIAQADLSKAINELTSGSFFQSSKELNKLHVEYGLELNAGDFEMSVPNLDMFMDYFNKLSDEIDRVYLSGNISDKQRKTNEQKVKEFYLKLMPILPEFIRRIAAIKTFEQRGKRVFNYMPVEAKFVSPATDKINSTIDIPDGVFEFFNIDPSKNLKDVDLPDTTYANETNRVKLKELSIINLPDYMDKIQLEAGIFRSLLLPANRKLLGIRDEMENFSKKKPQAASDVFNISKQKINWASRLTGIKAMLKAVTGQPVGFKGSRAYPSEEYNRFKQADLTYKKLIDFIEEKEDLGSDIYILSQKYLSQLALGNVNFFVPGALSNFLTGLQGLRKSIRDQLKMDREEVAICNEFISQLDVSPFFNSTIKPSWEALQDSIMDSPAAKDISKGLTDGDLRHVVNAIEGIERASLIANAVRCSKGNFPKPSQSDAFSNIIGAREDIDESKKGWYDQFKKESEQAVNTLKDQKAQLDSLKKLVTNG